MQNIMAAPEVMGKIERASQVFDEGPVSKFVETVNEADKLAKLKLDQKGLESWYGLGLQQIKDKLTNWGDGFSKEVLRKLNLFDRSELSLTGQLWAYVAEVIRPSKKVTAFPQLEGFLNGLCSKGWIDGVLNEPPRRGRDVIELRSQDRRNTTRYYCMEGKKTMAGMAWKCAKEVEKSARDEAREYAAGRENRFEELRNEDTGLTATQAMEGGEGKIFLTIDQYHHKGVLLAVEQSRRGLGPVLVVRNGVGIRLNDQPRWVGFNAPIREWDSPEIFYAVQAWKKASQPPAPPATPAPVPAGKPAE